MPTKRLSLADVTSKGSGLPNRYIIHATEKWGKTTFGAHFPSPVFVESRGETGLETLIDAGRLPEVPHFPECQTWPELLSAVETLTTEEHAYKTLVIDTLNGAEKLCHEEVCRRDFGNDWTDRGFMGYMRGYEVACNDWRQLLIALDDLREQRRMTVVCLVHTKVKTFKNPDGPDFDRYAPDMHDKTWGLSHKWADVILFGNFETFVQMAQKRDENNITKKGKGVGQTRMLYTERHAAYDAGNRLGLSSEIPMGNSGDEGWKNFKAAIAAARNGNIKQEEAATNG
jgi:hypothetical protein